MLPYSDIIQQNKKAWDKYVENGVQWTKPVSKDEIDKARYGDWKVVLTPLKSVPAHWFPSSMNGVKILCLACGGGQQGPIFAAAGASVTVFDNSPLQLRQDRLVAGQNLLEICTVEGDMTDLSIFEDELFDIVFNPVSNTYVPDVLPVWRECYRVLKDNGILMSGFTNPFVYLFDSEKWDKDILHVRNRLPYSSFDELDDEQRERFLSEGRAIEYSHTLEAQIGGQIIAGFIIDGFYEDYEHSGIMAQYVRFSFAS